MTVFIGRFTPVSHAGTIHGILHVDMHRRGWAFLHAGIICQTTIPSQKILLTTRSMMEDNRHVEFVAVFNLGLNALLLLPVHLTPRACVMNGTYITGMNPLNPRTTEGMSERVFVTETLQLLPSPIGDEWVD